MLKMAHPREPGDLHVGPLAHGQDLRADGARGPHPGQEGDDRRQHLGAEALFDHRGDDDQDRQARDGQADIRGAADKGVPRTAKVPGAEPQDDADQQARDPGQQADQERVLAAYQQDGKQLAAHRIGAQRVFEREGLWSCMADSGSALVRSIKAGPMIQNRNSNRNMRRMPDQPKGLGCVRIR